MFITRTGLLTIFFFVIQFGGIVATGQQLPSGLLNLDVFLKTASPDSEQDRKIAGNLIQLGRMELEKLKHQEKRFGLDEPTLIRKRILEESLSPINQLLEGDGSADSQDKLIKLMFDIETSKLVYSALGQERVMELVSKNIVLTLKKQAERLREHAYSPTTYMKNETIAKLLSLTDKQQNDLDELIEDYTLRMKHGDKNDFEKLGDLLTQHWKSLIAQLDVKQQEIAKDRIGEPVEWFRNAGKQTFRSRDFSLGGKRVMPGRHTSLRTSDGRGIFEMSPEELSKHGVEMFDSHTYEMMRSPFVWDELELSGSQRKEMKSISNVVAVSGRHLVRLEKLISGKARISDSLKEVLTDSQQDWFRQMEFQILTGNFESSMGLLHPKMVGHLQLSPEQTDNIKGLAIKYSAEAEELYDLIANARHQIRKEFAGEVEKILNDEQRAMFRRVTGDFAKISSESNFEKK